MSLTIALQSVLRAYIASPVEHDNLPVDILLFNRNHFFMNMDKTTMSFGEF